jgi:hypothetical protein
MKRRVIKLPCVKRSIHDVKKSLRIKMQRLIESENHRAIRLTDEAFEKIIAFLVESKDGPHKKAEVVPIRMPKIDRK